MKRTAYLSKWIGGLFFFVLIALLTKKGSESSLLSILLGNNMIRFEKEEKYECISYRC